MTANERSVCVARCLGWSQHLSTINDSLGIIFHVKYFLWPKDLLLFIYLFFLNLYLQKLQKPNLKLLMNASQQSRKNSKPFGKDCMIYCYIKVYFLNSYFGGFFYSKWENWHFENVTLSSFKKKWSHVVNMILIPSSAFVPGQAYLKGGRDPRARTSGNTLKGL